MMYEKELILNGRHNQHDEPSCFCMNELEDLRDYKFAVERLNAAEGRKTITFEELLNEDGITQADLEIKC